MTTNSTHTFPRLVSGMATVRPSRAARELFRGRTGGGGQETGADMIGYLVVVLSVPTLFGAGIGFCSRRLVGEQQGQEAGRAPGEPAFPRGQGGERAARHPPPGSVPRGRRPPARPAAPG